MDFNTIRTFYCIMAILKIKNDVAQSMFPFYGVKIELFNLDYTPSGSCSHKTSFTIL